MTWRLEFKRSAGREFDRLPSLVRERLGPRIDQLAHNPHPRGYRRLKGSDLCRIRVGNYRIVYGINDDERLIVVTAVRHRSRAYRGLR